MAVEGVGAVIACGFEVACSGGGGIDSEVTAGGD